MKTWIGLTAAFAFLVSLPAGAQIACTATGPEVFYQKARSRALPLPAPSGEPLADINRYTQFTRTPAELAQELARLVNSYAPRFEVINRTHLNRRFTADRAMQLEQDLRKSRELTLLKLSMHDDIKRLFGDVNESGLFVSLEPNSYVANPKDEFLEGFYLYVTKEGEEGGTLGFFKKQFSAAVDATVRLNYKTFQTEVCLPNRCYAFDSQGQPAEIAKEDPVDCMASGSNR